MKGISPEYVRFLPEYDPVVKNIFLIRQKTREIFKLENPIQKIHTGFNELLKNADEKVKKITFNKIQACYATGNISNGFTTSYDSEAR